MTADPAFYILNAIKEKQSQDDILRWLTSHFKSELENPWVARRIVHAFLLAMYGIRGEGFV